VQNPRSREANSSAAALGLAEAHGRQRLVRLGEGHLLAIDVEEDRPVLWDGQARHWRVAVVLDILHLALDPRPADLADFLGLEGEQLGAAEIREKPLASLARRELMNAYPTLQRLRKSIGR